MSDKSLLARFAANGNVDAVKIWIDCGLELDKYVNPGFDNRTALTVAIVKGQDKIAKMLLKAGSKVYYKSASLNPLTAAAAAGNEAMVKLLVEAGADVNEVVGQNSINAKYLLITPLMRAVKSPEVVSVLIGYGANVNAKDNSGFTPLAYAVSQSNVDSVKILLENGADVNARDRKGFTPIFYAVERKDTECVRILLENGADVNAKDSKGPLSYAVKNNDVETLKALLQHNTNFNINSREGKTVYDFAERKGATDVVRFFGELKKGEE